MTAKTGCAVELLRVWRLIGRPLLVAMLAAGACLALGQTLWEGKAGLFYNRAVLWDPVELTEPNLRLFYRQLSPELKGYRAWTVKVFTNREDAYREVSGKQKVEFEYDWWLERYNQFGRNLLPMAEILGYEKSAVLRLRDSSGVCSETVLAGDDFLRVRVSGVGFEILQARYRSLPPHTEPSPGDEAMISVYVRASSFPTVAQAREFTLLMRKRFQQKRIMVLFRTDAFFLTDGMFPIMYRFDEAATPPTLEQYKRSKTLYCFCDQPGTPCR